VSTEYVPGTCNIGAGEVRQRQVVAGIGFLLFISSAITLFAMDAPRSARLALFLPLMMASIGWVQSRRKFCLAYGFMGTFESSVSYRACTIRVHFAPIEVLR
jgi:hypothetical protein